MKLPIEFRFSVAALLMTIGWLGMLTGSNHAACFGFIPLLTLPRSELTKPRQNREVFHMVYFLIGLVAVFVACKLYVPHSIASTLDHLIFRPAIIVPIWLFALWILYQTYRKQKTAAAPLK